MFSDLFYLSNLLDISLAFNKKEKQDIFNNAKNNTAFCRHAVTVLEKEISTLAQYSESRKRNIIHHNEKTKKKVELIAEVQYSKNLHERFAEIKHLELSDKS